MIIDVKKYSLLYFQILPYKKIQSSGKKMYRDDIEYYKTQAQIVKAIAHPARLFILKKLKDNEYCVNSLTEMLGYDASTVSKHLSILKNAGLISNEKRGLKVFYRLRASCVLDMLYCVNSTVKQAAERNLKHLKR